MLSLEKKPSYVEFDVLLLLLFVGLVSRFFLSLCGLVSSGAPTCLPTGPCVLATPKLAVLAVLLYCTTIHRMKSVAAKLTEVRYFELELSAEERKRWLARKRRKRAAKKAGTIPVKQAACNYGSRTLTWEEVNTPDKVEANLTHQSQSVAGILSGDDWLRDSDVHAVFSLVVRTASRSRRSLQFQPQNAYPVDKNNLLSSLRRGDNIFGDVTEDVLFVPVNWSGSHWVLVIVDLRDSGRTIITYVDPLGGLVPALLKAAFTTRYDGAIFTQTSDRLQYDCCHCGVWCAIIAEHYLECCRSSCFDPACFELSHPKFVCNAVSLEHRRRNTSFIARRRRLYSAFL